MCGIVAALPGTPAIRARQYRFNRRQAGFQPAVPACQRFGAGVAGIARVALFHHAQAAGALLL